MKAIINGKIITKYGLLLDKSIVFDNKIVDIVSKNELDKYKIEEKIDAKGLYISPGFIDIHTHGIIGQDVMDCNEEAIPQMCKKYASAGVTSILATTMTMDRDSIINTLRMIERVKNKKGSCIVGCHLEGPFISKKYPGAQNMEYIIVPDVSLIEEFSEVISLVTIAPEVEGANELIKACVDKNITVSIGHSSATYEEAIKAIELGIKSITHTFNAMTPFHHRNPGVVGASLESERTYCELIADNIHVHPAAQRILLKAKGINKIILVSDSMRAAGMENGFYDLGGQTVEVRDHSARLEDGTLAGSILTLNEALRNFKKNTGLSIEEVVRTVTTNPSKLIGLENKGSLEIKQDADIVIFDHEFNIFHTFSMGNLCYSKQSK